MADKMQQIEKDLEALGFIGVFWHIDDVKEVRPDLTDDQCWQVLERVGSKHDCTVGIDWEVIRIAADLLYPEPDEAAEQGGAA